MQKRQIVGLTFTEIEAIVNGYGFKSSFAKKICTTIYRQVSTSFLEIDEIPLELRRNLDVDFEINSLSPTQSQQSTDGTVKNLYYTNEGNPFESAYMPSSKRNTLCISTQSGCRMGCSFCYTGTLGLNENLSSTQILAQVLNASRQYTVNRIVFMGMGEPLDNFEQVLRTLTVLNASWGMAFGASNITLSTIGVFPHFEQLAKSKLCNIAISMHSPFHNERREIIPNEDIYPLKQVVDFFRANPIQKPLRLSFEYIVFPGENDSASHATAIKDLLTGVNCHINIIPFNSKQSNTLSIKSAKDFQLKLSANGLAVTFRESRGQDIDAACGMMAGRGLIK